MSASIKMQVYLDPARYRSLKGFARKLGMTVAETIRNWIDEKTGTKTKKTGSVTKDPFWKCVGRGKSGKNDIAQHFDDYLYGEKS